MPTVFVTNRFMNYEEQLEWCRVVDQITVEEISKLSEKEKFDILYEIIHIKTRNKYRDIDPDRILELHKKELAGK